MTGELLLLGGGIHLGLGKIVLPRATFINGPSQEQIRFPRQLAKLVRDMDVSFSERKGLAACVQRLQFPHRLSSRQ